MSSRDLLFRVLPSFQEMDEKCYVAYFEIDALGQCTRKTEWVEFTTITYARSLEPLVSSTHYSEQLLFRYILCAAMQNDVPCRRGASRKLSVRCRCWQGGMVCGGVGSGCAVQCSGGLIQSAQIHRS